MCPFPVVVSPRRVGHKWWRRVPGGFVSPQCRPFGSPGRYRCGVFHGDSSRVDHSTIPDHQKRFPENVHCRRCHRAPRVPRGAASCVRTCRRVGTTYRWCPGCGVPGRCPIGDRPPSWFLPFVWLCVAFPGSGEDGAPRVRLVVRVFGCAARYRAAQRGGKPPDRCPALAATLAPLCPVSPVYTTRHRLRRNPGDR